MTTPDTPSTGSTRLNKYLALQLGVSRREADDLIARGSVSINGITAILGAQVSPSDTLAVNGQEIQTEKKPYVYLLFNKPVGFVCSRRQQGDSETIYSILPPEYHELKTVGRLDRDSSGLILLTNNGDFAHTMTHPKFVKMKIYNVDLGQELEPLHQQMISDYGVNLEDGKSQLGLERRSETQRRDWQVTMSEGRNRQIRRTFGALGYDVKKLHRLTFGAYSLGDIAPGEFKTFDIQ